MTFSQMALSRMTQGVWTNSMHFYIVSYHHAVTFSEMTLSRMTLGVLINSKTPFLIIFIKAMRHYTEMTFARMTVG